MFADRHGSRAIWSMIDDMCDQSCEPKNRQGPIGWWKSRPRIVYAAFGLLLPVVFVASLGPACRSACRPLGAVNWSKPNEGHIPYPYWSLTAAAFNSPLDGWMEWYVRLWIPAGMEVGIPLATDGKQMLVLKGK